jgi:hypothetical protein
MAYLETCRLNEILNYNKIILSEFPNNCDYQNKLLYSNLVVFFDIINENLSNIKILFNLIDYYLIFENYTNFVNKLIPNKKILQDLTTNVFMQNLSLIINISEKIKYVPNENIFQYIKYSNKLISYNYLLGKINKIIMFDNCFNVDVNFYQYINEIKLDFKSTLTHINSFGIPNGLIYHPKQINNFFPNLQIYFNKDKYYVENIELKEFVKNNIYEKTFVNFMRDFIDLEKTNIIDNKLDKNELELLIIVFIGDRF